MAPAAGVTISTGITRYLHERQARGELAPASVHAMRTYLRQFAAVVGPSRDVSRLTRRQIDRWWSTVTGGRSTLRNRLSTVRTFCRWLVTKGWLRRDPTRFLEAPREPRRVPRTFQRSQVEAIVAACPDERARMVVLLMVHCGLRAGEVARVQVGDIDFGARTILVHGKGGHERVLPVPGEAWAAVEAYLAAEPPVGAGPLLRSRTRPYDGVSAHYVSDLARVWLRAAGVKQRAYDGVSGHGLRRTCATDLLDGGANVRQVQAVLGHVSLATTERYLRAADPAELRTVMEGRSYRAG